MSVIELNGKRYDINTGQRLADLDAESKEPGSTTKSKRTIDGITPSSRIKNIKVKEKPKFTSIPVRHVASAAAVHLKQKKSITLMRSGLKRPVSSKPEDVSVAETASPTIAERLSVNDRLERANEHAKHELVNKFHKPPQDNVLSIDRQMGKIPLQEPPRHIKTSVNPAADAPSPSSQIFEKAMNSSTSHENQPEQTAPKTPRRLGAASSLAAMILLAGFIAFQNSHNLSVRIASNRAGMSASVPAYKPSGFSVSRNVSYGPGQVSINFRSRTDERTFSLVQQKTDWNNEDLLDNYVLMQSSEYQTIGEDDEQLITYGGYNATWIKDGIWYRVEGDSKLSGDQLMRIASSL